MSTFNFVPDQNSGIPKFQQLIDYITLAVNQKTLNVGDMLPSVNFLCKHAHFSRDTVVRAYNELKRRGIIESVPNKGYFVASNITRIFLFLDTFKAYKEVLYNSFRDNLPKKAFVDVHFHHYNYRVFESIILDSIGKYSKYIVMNFDDKRIRPLLKKIPSENLLIIDWNIHTDISYSFIRQDFGRAFYDNLKKGLHLLRKYSEFIYIYPEYTYHPKESIQYFKKFCNESEISYRVVSKIENEDIIPGHAFICLEDKELIEIIEYCKSMKYELGRDVGILSYNETPMKRIINEGITVVSIDFVKMGKEAALYASGNLSVQKTIPTNLIIRESL